MNVIYEIKKIRAESGAKIRSIYKIQKEHRSALGTDELNTYLVDVNP